MDTVLREVVESARALSGSRHGVITTVDEAGRPRDFVTSGLTPIVRNSPSPASPTLRGGEPCERLAKPLTESAGPAPSGVGADPDQANHQRSTIL